jgi:hypothetical protein
MENSLKSGEVIYYFKNMNIKLWWTFKKGQYKTRCNKVVEFLTSHRSLSEYPKTNKLFTTIFLIVINLYILIPLYNAVVDTFDVVYEPRVIKSKVIPVVLAKELDEKIEDLDEDLYKIDEEISQIVYKIYTLESSAGKNNYSKCEEQGLVNHYGYGIPGNGKFLCFENYGEETIVVAKWVEKKFEKGFNLEETLCIYNTGSKESCGYYEKYKSL